MSIDFKLRHFIHLQMKPEFSLIPDGSCAFHSFLSLRKGKKKNRCKIDRKAFTAKFVIKK